MVTDAENGPRKRGRPKLSPEERARRAKERAELNNSDAPPKKQATKKRKKPVVIEEPELVEEPEPAMEVYDDNDDAYTESVLSAVEECDIPEDNLRRYTFVIEENLRHQFGSRCADLSPPYVPASYVVNQLMKMYVTGQIQVEIDKAELERRWYATKVDAVEIPETLDR